MEIENKIYSIAEMREPAIFTAGYCFMDAPCTMIGTLLLKAQAHGKMLRLFFSAGGQKQGHHRGLLVAALSGIL